MPRGGWRPGAGRPRKDGTRPNATVAPLNGTAALKLEPPRQAKVISLREALGKLNAVPTPSSANGGATTAPPAPATAPSTPAHPLFAEGWQKFFAKRGSEMYTQWCEDYIREKKRREGGQVDEDELEMLALSLEQGLREQFPEWAPPWWAVALWCAGGIYWTLDKTGRPIADSRAPVATAPAPSAQTEQALTRDTPAAPSPDLPKPLIGTAPPRSPAPALEVDLPSNLPKSWTAYASRYPPARRSSSSAAVP